MTRKTRSFRPSPALVIGCLALFMALTGSAFAVGIAKNSVRSAQIVDGTVRTVDLRDNAVSVAEDRARRGRQRGDRRKRGRIARGGAGRAHRRGPRRRLGHLLRGRRPVAERRRPRAGLGPRQRAGHGHRPHQQRRKSPKAASGSVSADCAAGEQVLSGGGQPGHFGTEMTSSKPLRQRLALPGRATTPAREETITAYALCLAG